ncbi:MAG: Mammalian cell entry related domain protein [Solirubrobacterales bacterium]|nr:Mammalian cell entry related domain protein [Solirubrobacterales bacterium]
MTTIKDRFGMAGLGAVALIVALAITLFWYLGYAYDYLHKDGATVTAEFSAVPQLQTGDPVRVDGQKAGEVRKIEDIGGGRGAKVTFDVEPDAGPLYRDSVVELRWRNLLGSSFYLEVDRGTKRSGPLGDHEIPRAHTVQQVELDDVTSIFKGGVRRGLTTLPKELAKGLRDPNTLPNLLDEAQRVSPSLQAGAGALRGREPDVDLRRVLTGTAATVAALDAPDDDLQKLVSGAASLVSVTAAREADLRATLDDGPALTQNVDLTLTRLDRTLKGADTLVAKLDRAAPGVAPTLAELRPTLGDTSGLLAQARPLVRTLRPTVLSLASLSRQGTPLLDALQPSVDRLDDKILPYLSRKDPGTGKPTSVMIGGTAAGFGGLASQQDGSGHLIRFPATAGTKSVYLPCKAALTDPTAAQALACDSLQTALKNYLNYVPSLKPAPGGGSK